MVRPRTTAPSIGLLPSSAAMESRMFIPNRSCSRMDGSAVRQMERLVSPVTRSLHVESLGWAPSTPAGGVKGEVVLLEDISADAIKAKTAQIKGKIVMLNFHKIFEDGEWKAFPELMASAQLFKSGNQSCNTFCPFLSDRSRRSLEINFPLKPCSSRTT